MTAEAFLLKTNSTGDSMWSVRRIGSQGGRYGISVVQTIDSGYAWGTMNNDIQSYDPYQVLKSDQHGNFLWQSDDAIYSYSSTGNGSSLQMTMDNGFIVTGTDARNFGSQYVIALTKLDSSGNLLWDKFFTGNLDCNSTSVWQTSDSGYVLGGFTNSYGIGGNRWYLIKTNASGDSLWSKVFYSSGGINTVQQISDGGYMAAGITTSYGAGANDIQLMKLNANGDSLWSKTFGGINNDILYHASQCTDGGFIMVGYTESFGNGGRDIYVIKTDSSGNIVTGITNETAAVADINIFPNPATNAITLNLNSNCTAYKVNLKDLKGITILRNSFEGNISKSTLDLPDNISAGIYLLEINFNENVLTKKVVIVD
jgi:hypothetical protein